MKCEEEEKPTAGKPWYKTRIFSVKYCVKIHARYRNVQRFISETRPVIQMHYDIRTQNLIIYHLLKRKETIFSTKRSQSLPWLGLKC